MSSKKVAELTQSDMTRIVITDIPMKIPGLDACAMGVVGEQYISHPLSGGRVSGTGPYIVGPIPVVLARGRGHAYVVMYDYTCEVHMRPIVGKIFEF